MHKNVFLVFACKMTQYLGRDYNFITKFSKISKFFYKIFQKFPKNFKIFKIYQKNFIFPPFHFYMNKRSIPLGYLKQTIGRKGIFELEEKQGRFFVPWQVVFFKPNDKNTYRIKINPNGENDPGYFNHHLSDTYSLPSLSSSEA